VTEQLPPFVPWQRVLELRDEVVLVEVSGAERPAVRGAVLVDLDRDLSAPAGPTTGRHPLPTPEAFAQAMSRAGVAENGAVVALDDSGGVMAARLVLMLRATGHRAALLDGPPGEGDVPSPRVPARFSARPWPDALLADAADALDPGNVVLDARPRGRYLGDPDPLDPRPGHVPGARSLPCRESLDADGRLLPEDVLRERFAAAGVGSGAPVVVYCGSGVTACHDLLVMEHLGLGSGRLYVGSWSQYAADPERPVSLLDER
jgi:thiosulfate/3-mercaptopyruvate sulfurtransferase